MDVFLQHNIFESTHQEANCWQLYEVKIKYRLGSFQTLHVGLALFYKSFFLFTSINLLLYRSALLHCIIFDMCC